jgi:hypothetical protein
MFAVATPRTDVKSFRLAHPAVRTTTGFELTVSALLTLSAAGLWLLVLPLELLRATGL